MAEEKKGKIYTYRDPKTKKKVKFRWNKDTVPTPRDVAKVFAAARTQEKSPPPPPPAAPPKLSGYEQTKTNILKGVPALETAAHLATSSYGIPASGIAGAAAFPFAALAHGDTDKGLDFANKVRQGVEDLTVYHPQGEGGKQLTEAVTWPLKEWDQFGEWVGEGIEELGYPNVGAGVHSAITGAPALWGVKKAISRPTKANVINKLERAIDKGVNRAIRPSAMKKETWTQLKKYRRKARVAVKTIAAERHNLRILDKEGKVINRMPHTLEEMGQAVHQSKIKLFEAFDQAAKETGAQGKTVSVVPIADELQAVVNNRVLQDRSPETVSYAQQQIEVHLNREAYTAVEAQHAIKILNETQKEYLANPNQTTRGKAYVDAMIANRLRESLHKVVEATTGKNYKGLKQKYGALRMLETDLTKRITVYGRQAPKSIFDFSDIYTGFHIAHGLMTKDPALVTAGAAARAVKTYIKFRNSPNNIIKTMFSEVEKMQGLQRTWEGVTQE